MKSMPLWMECWDGTKGRGDFMETMGRPSQVSPLGTNLALKYDEDDVIGCGVNFEKQTAFSTKNGTLVGASFCRDLKTRRHLMSRLSIY
jgi:hypothetical protein